MKVNDFSWKGLYLDPDAPNIFEEDILAYRYPKHDNEGATHEYLDDKLIELGPIEVPIPIPAEHLPPLIGERFKQYGADELVLNPKYTTPNEEDTYTGYRVTTDKNGFVTSMRLFITSEDFDDDFLIPWHKVIDKPSTLEDYGIKDVITVDGTGKDKLDNKFVFNYDNPYLQNGPARNMDIEEFNFNIENNNGMFLPRQVISPWPMSYLNPIKEGDKITCSLKKDSRFKPSVDFIPVDLDSNGEIIKNPKNIKGVQKEAYVTEDYRILFPHGMGTHLLVAYDKDAVYFKKTDLEGRPLVLDSKKMREEYFLNVSMLVNFYLACEGKLEYWMEPGEIEDLVDSRYVLLKVPRSLTEMIGESYDLHPFIPAIELDYKRHPLYKFTH